MSFANLVNPRFRHDIRHFNHIVHNPPQRIRHHTINTKGVRAGPKMRSNAANTFFNRHGRHLLVGAIGGGLSVGLGFSSSFAKSALFFGAMDFGVKHFVEGDPIKPIF